MALTEITTKQAQPREKDHKISDGRGLYLLVKTSGAKYWRMKYRFAGTEKTLALGVYPEVGLKAARLMRDKARLILANGVDPGLVKQTRKRQQKEAHENSFQAIALEWYGQQKSNWADNTAEKQLWILEKNLFPWIGAIPITELEPQQLLKTLRRIEARGAIETSHRAMQVASQVCRYAIASGLLQSDPARDLKGALKPKKTQHHPAITDPKKADKLMRDIDQYEGTHVVRTLLALSPLLFQRPGELRQMEWSEIDFDKECWEIPAHKMKMRDSHIVPLSMQAVALLKDIQPLTGWGEYVFPNERRRKYPASDGTVNKALRNLGYTKHTMTAHGFRAMARTMLEEELNFPRHIIEQQLSHEVSDPMGRAYNRTTHLPLRKEMMQRWADYLDKLKQGAVVVHLLQRA